MNDIKSIADWFLKKEPMTHKKLQKLCYYAQAWSYALRDRPIASTTFEAWIHGPVSPELYRDFAVYGFQDIPSVKNGGVQFAPDEEELLESVWETYGESTGNALEVLSHSELPWIKARGKCLPEEHCQNKIMPDDMKSYYRSIYLGDTSEFA